MAAKAKSAARAKPVPRRETGAGRKPAARSALPLDKHGNVAVDDVVETFGLSKVQIARSLGLPKEAVHKRDRLVARQVVGDVPDLEHGRVFKRVQRVSVVPLFKSLALGGCAIVRVQTHAPMRGGVGDRVIFGF